MSSVHDLKVKKGKIARSILFGPTLITLCASGILRLRCFGHCKMGRLKAIKVNFMCPGPLLSTNISVSSFKCSRCERALFQLSMKGRLGNQ